MRTIISLVDDLEIIKEDGKFILNDPWGTCGEIAENLAKCLIIHYARNRQDDIIKNIEEPG